MLSELVVYNILIYTDNLGIYIYLGYLEYNQIKCYL